MYIIKLKANKKEKKVNKNIYLIYLIFYFDLYYELTLIKMFNS